MIAIRITARQIIDEIAVTHDTTREDIIGPRRYPHLVEARREAMRRVRDELGYSYPQIGRIFNRDHSSVIWSLRGGRFNQSRQERAA
jgi:chromosomal replication initiator protein